MCTTNRQRRKKLILAYPDTRRLYRMMQVLAVFLVVATICIFAVGKWSENQIKEKNDQLFGRWNEVFLNVDEEDVEYFRRHAFVDDYSVQNIQEKIYLEGDERIIIGTCDNNFFELGNLEMIDGRMPVNEGEVAIEEEYLDVLGVEKVGDIISEGVNIDSLKGYKVCGIVKDYSSRWKMVNWDVKYINCFISDAKANEIQIYASLSLAVQQDIETNMLEYRENIRDGSTLFFEDIIWLCWMIGLLEMILFAIIRRKLNEHKKAIMKLQSRKSKNMNNFFVMQAFYLIMTISLKALSLILIIWLLNKLIMEVNYNTIIYANVMQIMPNKNLKKVIEAIVVMSWIMLINKLLNFLEITAYNMSSSIKIKKSLDFYYYGRQKIWRIHIILDCVSEIIIILLIFMVLLNVLNLEIVFALKIFLTFCVIDSIFLIYRITSFVISVNKIEDRNDWLLVNEFE